MSPEAEGLLIVLADCLDPNREAEFNQWYNEVHIPDIEALGFVGNTKRYVNVMAESPSFLGRPKYLALWEVYRSDLKQALKEIRQRGTDLIEQGRGFEAKAKMMDALYQKAGPDLTSDRSSQPSQGVYLVLSSPTDPAREDEFNEWYDQRHGPDVLSLGFQDTCSRYKIVDASEVLPYRYYYATVYSMSMDPLEARHKLVGFRSKWLADPTWVDLLAVHWTGGFRQIYPPLEWGNPLAGNVF